MSTILGLFLAETEILVFIPVQYRVFPYHESHRWKLCPLTTTNTSPLEEDPTSSSISQSSQYYTYKAFRGEDSRQARDVFGALATPVSTLKRDQLYFRSIIDRSV